MFEPKATGQEPREEQLELFDVEALDLEDPLERGIARWKTNYWTWANNHPLSILHKYLRESLNKPKNGLWDFDDKVEEIQELIAEMEAIQESTNRHHHHLRYAIT